jgi:hypothetical protein
VGYFPFVGSVTGDLHSFSAEGYLHIRVSEEAPQPKNPLDLVSECDRDGNPITFDEQVTRANKSPFAQTETELERLVRVANEGEAARSVLLSRYRDAFEWRTTGANASAWYEAGSAAKVRDYRTKPKPARPKPAFPEMYVNQKREPGLTGALLDKGWNVSLSDDGKVLNIGCKKYESGAVLTALRAIKSGQYSSFTIYDDVLQSYRDGIGRTSCQGKDLSWSDADRLLTALEKYFADLAAYEQEYTNGEAA